ncbi:hypothetical protein PFISCL1PPCAC_1464, partial [Pristionchus fissidentatus]
NNIYSSKYFSPITSIMNSIYYAFFALCWIYLVRSQCTGNDDPRCAGWVSQSFCANTGYSVDVRKMYCGVACGLCNRDGTQTALGGGNSYTSCIDLNANCAAMAAGGFCTNTTLSRAAKLRQCCKTCRPTVLATSTTALSSSTTTTTTTTT